VIDFKQRFISSWFYAIGDRGKCFASFFLATKQAKKDTDNERQVMLSEAHKPIKPTAMERFAEMGVWLAIGVILGFWLR
jgi:hypothetical protein